MAATTFEGTTRLGARSPGEGRGGEGTLRRSLLGGLVGGVVVEAYLLLFGLTSWPAGYEYLASGLVGPAAFTSTTYAWLGLGLHFGVSLAWGLAFGLAALAAPALLRRPIGAGVGFGLVVLAAMQVVLALAGLSSRPTPAVVAHLLISHTVFFGVPVALVTRGRSGPRDRLRLEPADWAERRTTPAPSPGLGGHPQP